MSDTKRRSRPVVQRVGTNLRLRGCSYEFRKVIPPEARSAFGGLKEYVRSFGDVTRKEAERLASFHRAYCNGLISEARGKSKPKKNVIELIRMTRMPERQEIERAVRDWLLHREVGLGTSLFADDGGDQARDLGFMRDEVVRRGSVRSDEGPLLTRWIANALVEANGWAVPESGELRRFLETCVGRAQFELAARVEADQEIGKIHAPTHRIFEQSRFDRDREERRTRTPPVSIMTVYQGYEAEQEPTPATIKAWKSALNSLISHLGHDDATRITTDDLISWKDALLAPQASGVKRRSQVTVKHKYLGAVKPVFAWAVKNKLIPENPAVGVTVGVPRKVRNRAERGYTEAEAKRVLAAASAIDTNADQSFAAFARRWLPWLCAYTGARVGEMAQLRRQDLGQHEDGAWFLTITPEAGSQKGGFTRQVALHPHLIEQGFLEATKARSGPLFYDPTRKRDGSIGNPQHKKVAQRVAEWVRHTVGLTDKELQPNHGWRHRFITIARDIRMDPDVRRAITGHSALDEHGDYGDTLIRSSHRWLADFPRYEVQARPAGPSPKETAETLQPVATAAE